MGRRTGDDAIGGHSALDRKRRVGVLEARKSGVQVASNKSGPPARNTIIR
jgi:hypothetical protein